MAIFSSLHHPNKSLKQLGKIEHKVGQKWDTNSNSPELDKALDEACKDTPATEALCVNLCNIKYKRTNGWAYSGRASKHNTAAISILMKQQNVLAMAEV